MTRILPLAVGSILVASVSRPPVVVIRESDLRPLLLRPGVVSLIGKSQRPLLVDLMWLRALNSIGDPDSPRKNRGLYEYGVALTESDPRFYHAYSYLGLNITARKGRSWFNGELADDLFARGLKQFPDDLRLHLFRANNLFFALKDFPRASAEYLAASRLPDAPLFLGPLAVRIKAQTDPAAGIAIAQELLNGATNPELVEDLKKKIRILETEKLFNEVDSASEAFKAARGRLPRSLDELRGAGIYDGPSVDGEGEPVLIDSAGKATSRSADQSLKLYFNPNEHYD